MAASLGDIAKVDRAWGGSGLLARWLLARIPLRQTSPASILDIGAGSALPSGRLRRRLAEAGLDSKVFALDLQWRHLAAGARMDGREPLPGLTADAFHLPLPAGSVDWVVATLLLHHFSPVELSELFVEIRRVARRGFALLDLRRHRAPLAFVAVAGRFAFRSRVSVHDGIASVRQAYTPEELRAIVSPSAPRARVEAVFPFRILVSSSP
jgi:SAM-dependent methyltransferase